jgi:hypothetical protein
LVQALQDCATEFIPSISCYPGIPYLTRLLDKKENPTVRPHGANAKRRILRLIDPESIQDRVLTGLINHKLEAYLAIRKVCRTPGVIGVETSAWNEHLTPRIIGLRVS